MRYHIPKGKNVMRLLADEGNDTSAWRGPDTRWVKTVRAVTYDDDDLLNETEDWYYFKLPALAAPIAAIAIQKWHVITKAWGQI